MLSPTEADECETRSAFSNMSFGLELKLDPFRRYDGKKFHGPVDFPSAHFKLSSPEEGCESARPGGRVRLDEDVARSSTFVRRRFFFISGRNSDLASLLILAHIRRNFCLTS